MHECKRLAKYINTATNDPLVHIVEEDDTPKQNGSMAYIEIARSRIRKSNNEAHRNRLEGIKLYGDYFRRRPETINVDSDKSIQWLE